MTSKIKKGDFPQGIDSDFPAFLLWHIHGFIERESCGRRNGGNLDVTRAPVDDSQSFEKDRSGVYNDVQHSDLVMSSGPFLKL